jgi:DNA-binding transcriptional ArsR family regulator
LLVDAFDALADPVRRDLLAAVSVRPMRVADLAAGQTVSRPAVSRHLRVLTEAGLVDVEDRGRERHYALRPEPLAQVRDFLDRITRSGATRKVTTEALDALDTEVRRTVRERRRPRSTSEAPREDIA